MSDVLSFIESFVFYFLHFLLFCFFNKCFECVQCASAVIATGDRVKNKITLSPLSTTLRYPVEDKQVNQGI